MKDNKRSLMSKLGLVNLIRVCIGVLVFGLWMAASTNLSAQAKTKEQAMAERFRGQSWQIQAKHSGLYLDLKGATTGNGDRVAQWVSHPGNQQRWLIEPVPGGGGKVYIIAMHSGLFLDNIGAVPQNGVGQWSYQPPKEAEKEGRQQMWWLEDEGGYVKIKNDLSGMYLDVLGQNPRSGAAVSLWDNHPGDQQKWKLIPAQRFTLPILKEESWSDVPPELTAMGTPISGKSVVVEEILVPFFFVSDPTAGGAERVSRYPYYIMSTRKQWVPQKFWQNTSAKKTMDITVTETSRKETSIKTEIEKSISATVTAEMSYGIFDASVSVTGSLTEKTATGEVVEKGNSKTYVESIDEESIVVFWNDVHNYKLMRLDGAEVKSWKKEGQFIVKNKFTRKN